VVASRPLEPAQLSGARIGIPGATTTAYLVLRLIAPGVEGIEIPISPFARIFDALATGEVDAAILIHEGRLLYRERGLHLCVDLGSWWANETGLPLPLGVNVIRRSLGPELVARVSRVVKRGIDWAAAHRAEVIRAMTDEERGDKRLKDAGLLDEYLKLYANDDTAALPEDARRAIGCLFERARATGLIPNAVSIDWAP
jgi:1,4-dihydroxy-6-naphthoate synthase